MKEMLGSRLGIDRKPGHIKVPVTHTTLRLLPPSPSTLWCGRDLVFTLQLFHPSLCHEVCNVFLQVVNATAHVIKW